jgi:tRNA threonylcarbamoyladenosine biosynthesis protein TsaB
MRILVIDTATTACSVALFDGELLLANIHDVIGRGHAERLIPAIKELPDHGKAHAIHVNVGPGSFTGIRVGVSAARALAFAWQIECRGYSSLALIAAMARQNAGGALAVDSVIPGGHGEVFFQSFDAQGFPLSAAVSITPEDAAARSQAPVLAGPAAHQIAERRGSGSSHLLSPDAQYWPLLVPFETVPPSPLYVRGPDANLPKKGAL